MSHFVKYPRTYHLPWSESVSDDDRVMDSLSCFEGQRVVVTEKMDGENTSLYRDHMHARSIDGSSHPARDWVRRFWAEIKDAIPEGWRVCGENLFAKHSIHYRNLPTYFMGFSVWDERNVCLGWEDTLEWLSLLGVTPVPVLYDGIFDETAIRSLWNDGERAESEGYVVRLAEPVEYGDFRKKFAKFVRAGHVQTGKHWMYGQSIERNLLARQQ